MSDTFATSFGVLNYSGMLFNKGNISTPFSSMIGARPKVTNSVEFVTGQEYQSGDGSQPSISETDSLTAPEASVVTRTQKTNVTQIFQYAVGISYAKQSNMGTLSGANIAGQKANPMNELDFQVAQKINQANQDIEYTFINGAYAKANNDATANMSRGLLAAIEPSNTIDLDGKALGFWDVAEATKLIKDANAPYETLVLGLDTVTLFQLNADAKQNGLTIVPADRTINGIQLQMLVTPLGTIYLRELKYLPPGTAVVFNPNVISPVYQPVPGKGNFFLEQLAKTGAGEKYQLFGQIGLDHGPGWYHAKITGINTNFVKPKSGIKVYTVDPIEVTEVFPEIESATLGSAVYDTATPALVITYIGQPLSDATLTYQWKKGDFSYGQFENITGATGATYTPTLGDLGKFIKCKVTAAGTAIGTVSSNAKQVKPIEVNVTSEIASGDPDAIVSTLSAAVAGLEKANFEVTKNSAAYTDFTVSAGEGNTVYTLALGTDAVAGDVFTVAITKAGYSFVGTAVDNKVA